MADFNQLQQGLASGFQIGQKTGGKLAGLGLTIQMVADRLRERRQTGEALDLLGQTEAMKAKIAASPEYQTPKDIAQAEKDTAQAKYWNKASGQISEDGSSDLIYRDALTGQEVDSNTAMMDIESGNNNYIVSKRILTRGGERESKLVEPKKLTEGETKALTNAEAISTQLGDLKDIVSFDATRGLKGSLQKAQMPVVGAFTKEGQRYRLIRGDIADRLLRLRSGAQINEQEYKRLNNLLPKIFRREDVDLEQLNKFENDFNSIVQRIKTGRMDKKELKNPGKSPIADLSTMSDEELMNIAGQQ